MFEQGGRIGLLTPHALWSMRVVRTVVFVLAMGSDHSWVFTSHHLLIAPVFGSSPTLAKAHILTAKRDQGFNVMVCEGGGHFGLWVGGGQ